MYVWRKQRARRDSREGLECVLHDVLGDIDSVEIFYGGVEIGGSLGKHVTVLFCKLSSEKSSIGGISGELEGSENGGRGTRREPKEEKAEEVIK
ncbi:hypothetical protein ACFX13_045091 [Malus domestica]